MHGDLPLRKSNPFMHYQLNFMSIILHTRFYLEPFTQCLLSYLYNALSNTDLGHKRCLTIKNCSEEVDQGQYIVKLVPPVGMQALDSVRIGHLRVGAQSPKVELVAKYKPILTHL